MASLQTTIRFNVRKTSSKTTSFYGSKDSPVKQDFTNAALREVNVSRYTPTVKKIVTLSSSDSDSDSDAENSRVPAKNCRKRNGEKSSELRDRRGATPPKQKRSPVKPSSPSTPSGLLEQLNLESLNKESKLAPKKLFQSRFQSARKALHSSAPLSLPGREKELEELRGFLSDRLRESSSGSLYVSGPPGTGKTASLSKIMLEPGFKSAFKVIYVNCTGIKSAAAIYAKIVTDLGLDLSKTEKGNRATIQKHLASKHKMILLVLDEIDQLSSRKQSVLYTIFEWPSNPRAKLVLVGIANALDLTDRILPRLQARCELKPKLMHFGPYSKQQIVDIIGQRLKEADVGDVLNGPAVQMLAGKVAAVSGDIRRALDIGRRVIEIAEDQRTSQILKPCNDNDTNTSGNGPSKRDQIAGENPVALKDVVTVLSGVYGGVQNIDSEESIYPLQQKLLLCSLMLILNEGRNKDVTIGMLYTVYKRVCKKRNIHSVDTSEFVGLCSLVETRGILRIVGKKEPRLSKVHLQWDQDELGLALQDQNLMAGILNDVSCL